MVISIHFQKSGLQADHNTLLFRDGRRRIDMVVVWEVDKSGVPTELEAMRGERRQRFQAALEAEGLQLEFEGPQVGTARKKKSFQDSSIVQ